jgi:signal peptidase II
MMSALRAIEHNRVMAAFVSAALLVFLVDQMVKRAVRTRMAARRISLGMLGELRVVHTRMWMMRGRRSASLGVVWGIWGAAAAVSAAIAAILPDLRWAFGLLVGGAFSHALETTRRGTVCDYVCLRFWPAFNLADVALTVGALSVLWRLTTAL